MFGRNCLWFGMLALTCAAGLSASGDAQAEPLRPALSSQNMKARGGRKPKPRVQGSEPGKPNAAVRRMLSGRYPNHSTAPAYQSPELLRLGSIDRELFPPVAAPAGAPWRQVYRSPSAVTSLPTGGGAKAKPASAKPVRDTSWILALTKPDFPVRYEPAVVRYLEHYKNSKRGRRLLAAFVRKSGRYRTALRAALRKEKLPEDLMWLAMVESGFDSKIHSHAGAAGLWQFMPATGRIYGLTVNRRVDERLDPERSTMAAARHLKDLYQRFGTWELAFAAYNMGYGGVLSSMRKYNTNDYWQLRRYEAALPYETAMYAPKIVALAVAANNCKVFGCDDVTQDAALAFGGVAGSKLAVAPFVTLKEVAKACGVKTNVIEALNPHVIGDRLPPLQHSTLPRTAWTVFVPPGKAKTAAGKLPKPTAPPRYATHRIRRGESLEHVALRYDTKLSWLRYFNDLERHQAPPADSVIFVPHGRTPKTNEQVLAAMKRPLVVVPNARFELPKLRRVFYRSVFGDTVEDVARDAGVTVSELRRWNQLSRRASLQNGMTVQLFVPKDAQLPNVLLWEASDVTLLTAGSKAFHAHFLKSAAKERIVVKAREGDTLVKIAKRYGSSSRSLERINHKHRRKTLRAGTKVVVYVKRARLAALRQQARDAKKAAAVETSVGSASTQSPSHQSPSRQSPAPQPPTERTVDAGADQDTDELRDGPVPVDPGHGAAPDADANPPVQPPAS